MEKKLLALLDRSNLFSSDGKVQVNSPEKFHFFLPIFSYPRSGDRENKKNYFELGLRDFILRYLKTWVCFLEPDPKNPFNWEKFSFSMAQFFSSFSCSEYFEKLESGKDAITIPITPNNSKLLACRMGDVMAFGVYQATHEEKEHITGRRTVEALCREDNPNNNQGVYELVRNVQISLPLPLQTTKNGGTEREVDFGSMSRQMEVLVPYVSWKGLALTEIVESYKHMNSDGSLVGTYFNLPIYARLIHDGVNNVNDISHENFPYVSKASTWRIGNVSKVDNWNYVFREGENLKIIFSLESSVPRSTVWNKVDSSLKILREQFILSKAAAILITSLCSFQLNVYQERMIKLNS